MTNNIARAKQLYNHSSGSKLFLQQQHELIEQQGQPVDREESFEETLANMSGQFVSQAATNVHHQMLELQSQLTPEGSRPLSEDEICETVLGRQPDYSKSLGWSPKPKSRNSGNSSSSSYSQEMHYREVSELRVSLDAHSQRLKNKKVSLKKLNNWLKNNKERVGNENPSLDVVSTRLRKLYQMSCREFLSLEAGMSTSGITFCQRAPFVGMFGVGRKELLMPSHWILGEKEKGSKATIRKNKARHSTSLANKIIDENVRK
ncbi:CACTA en-spm transposon protein [Cucumis melo var. makuwa]|uniref:CACTA en-spm transposon protein n=1 Tax=Cucumis melo var. makuwa TaxID=1194695 RepID=A0A5A7TVR7_CUCMM|nr:CACTA en-spm transposon protein [Cucumis melo var. makuwa]